nr:HNH endonuclease signature motif containing protein [uncultured Rhodoferax sp.]
MDHIIPLCAGGADSAENLQWLTREDHKAKTRIDVRECRRLKQ